MSSREEARRFHPASASDYVPRAQLRTLQLERLRGVVRRAWDHVWLFRERMAHEGLSPDLRSLEDLARLPFGDKADLVDGYPYGLLAAPLEQVVRLHATPGTSGKPVVVAYTQGDLDTWTEVMVRSLAACGLHRGDVVQNAWAYGLYTGAMGAHFGAEALGATVIPSSAGGTDRQIDVLQDLGVTAICCTPSYFLHLVERGRELGADLRRLRVGIFGGEPWSEGMRRRIEADTGIRAHDLYGVSELMGPGIGVECSARAGLHLFEDHFLPEVVDPRTGEVLPEGAEGELVLTTLSREAMPMIRYRTRDVTAFIPEPCACGRTLRRIRRIRRRSDDMIIVRGVSLYPSQVETALLAVEGTLPHYQVVLTRDRGLDEMEVRVEVTAAVFSDEMRGLAALQEKLEAALEHTLGLRVRVTLVAPRTLQRTREPARRVVDERTP